MRQRGQAVVSAQQLPNSQVSEGVTAKEDRRGGGFVDEWGFDEQRNPERLFVVCGGGHRRIFWLFVNFTTIREVQSGLP